MMKNSTTPISSVPYAPVIIPTLCRYTHFKRCLESIERCTGASNTDVYVALDYPPSAEYIEGWKRIDSYLKEKEKSNGFRNLIVRRRDHNCGVFKEGSNHQLLVEEIEKKSDRYIFSEDDNEFSPNFLDYMNKSLEHYKNEPNVLYVSAYTPPIFKQITHNNTFFGLDTPAYGLGCWTYKTSADMFSNTDLKNILHSSIKKTLKLYWTWPALLNMALDMVINDHDWGDVRHSIYNYFHHTYTLQPSVSLCRNWGCDGSGVNSGFVKNRELEEIQSDSEFALQDIAYEYPQAMIKKLFHLNMPKNKLKFIKQMFLILKKFSKFYHLCK